jgi:hypothetical protein
VGIGGNLLFAGLMTRLALKMQEGGCGIVKIEIQAGATCAGAAPAGAVSRKLYT